METPTPEQIARHYSAMLDSVTLITSLVGTKDADELDTISRNVAHLEHMLGHDWWKGYDLKPITDAIKAGKQ